MVPSRSHIAIFFALAAIPLAARAEDFVTAKGKVVAMPDITTLTCEEIELTLSRIDSTRYRENTPVPHDRADDPLHRYEQDLAKALFQVCVVDSQPRGKAPDPPGPQQQQAGRQ